MQTNHIKRVHENKKRMQVARGGKRGKTSGRGGKGQTARAGNKRRPDWRDTIKKLPKLRGRGKNSNKTVLTATEMPVAISLSMIDSSFGANESVTPISLIEKGVVSTIYGKAPIVKILAGKLSKAVKISGCAVSASARAEIEKAGGTIEEKKPA